MDRYSEWRQGVLTVTTRQREPQSATNSQARSRTDAALGSKSTEGDQPDPVTLSEPTFDSSGRLRWSSSA